MLVYVLELTQKLTGVLSGAITNGLSGLTSILGKRGLVDEVEALGEHILAPVFEKIEHGKH